MVNMRHKPADTLQDRRASRTKSAPVVPEHIEDPGMPRGELSTGEFRIAAPPPPKGLLRETSDAWAILWASPIREILISADLVVLHRYIRVLDENRRAWSNYSRKKTGLGSTGQPQLSIWWTAIKDTEAMAAKLEASLGIGPLSRMRLNVTFADAVTKLAEAYSLAVKGKSGGDGLPGDVVEDD